MELTETSRQLTPAQASRLDKMAKENPDAIVVGWHHAGPLVYCAGKYCWIAPEGRKRPLRKHELAP